MDVKVGIRTTIDFNATSDSIIGGHVQQVRKAMNDMFDALERFEKDKGISLRDIKISTMEQSDIGVTYNYHVKAGYVKYEQ